MDIIAEGMLRTKEEPKMPNLKCHQTNCDHNHDIRCGLAGICVSRSALCDSFDRREAVEFDAEYARELAFTFTDSQTEVLCFERSCLNNVDGSCGLKNLRVDNVDGLPQCVNVRRRRQP